MSDNSSIPAEEIRSAAKLMRKRAQATEPGPWQIDHDHAGSRYIYGDDGTQTAIAECYPDADRSVPAAEHIASWHPLVALAVADWLDIEAAALERKLPDESGTVHAALRIARAYLEVPDA